MQEIIHSPAAPLGDEIPPAVRMVVEKAVEKEPAERYQTAREMVVDLKRALRRGSAEMRPPALRAPTRQSRLGFLLAALAGAAGLLAGYFLQSFKTPVPAAKPSVHVQRLTDIVGLEEAPAISPDGRSVAFVGGAGGRNVKIARRIAWSRDSQSIYASVSDVDSDIVMLSGLKW